MKANFGPPLKKNCHCRSSNSPIWNIFICFGDIRRQTSKSSKIGPNFACFWPHFFWGGRSPEMLDRHYKTRPSVNHRAKFRADQPTHLGDFALNKNCVAKHKEPRNLGQGPTWVRPAPQVRLGKKLGGEFSGSKVTWPERKCIGIRRTRIVDLG